MEKMSKWAECLCKQGSVGEFLLFRESSLVGELDAIMEYRKVLRGRGNSNLLFIKFEHEYINRRMNEVLAIAEMIFLEPVTASHMRFLIAKTKAGIDITELHNKYNQNPDIRFLTAVRSM